MNCDVRVLRLQAQDRYGPLETQKSAEALF